MRYIICLLAFLSTSNAFSADYSKDRTINDNRWLRFNYMYADNELPGQSQHDYVELEFGGRSGIFDVFGYVDFFNPADNKSSDKYEQEKLYMKIAPRMSLDGLFRKDFSFGPVKELYVAGVTSTGGAGHVAGRNSVNGALIGLGADIDVPVMGVMGWAVYGQYDINNKNWNGYQLSTGWFRPFIHFDNKSFISYQGYADFNFGMKHDSANNLSSTGFDMFNGLYWHYDKISLGYGLKLFNNVYGLKNGGFAGKTTGVAHYFSVGYLF